MVVNDIKFDWFSTGSNIALTLSTDFFPKHVIPPPSPLLFRPSFLKIWPISSSALLSKAPEYKCIYDIVRSTGLPNYLGAWIPIPSGLQIVWRKLLLNYPDNSLVDYLEFGWPLDYTKTTPPTPTLKNHAVGADVDFHIINYINTEIAHKALIGPFENIPFEPWCQISPLMTNPKRILIKNE